MLHTQVLEEKEISKEKKRNAINRAFLMQNTA